MSNRLTVRAIDVGYGHIKFTTGRDPQSGLLTTDSFPSQSPRAQEPTAHSVVLNKRDTHIVKVGEGLFEVGHDVGLAIDTFHDGTVLDQDFPASEAYAARLYGALSYIYPTLPDNRTIDYLVLGLPMTTIQHHTTTLQERFTGSLRVNTQGHTVTVRNVVVYPQPLGSYMAYLAANPATAGQKKPLALVIDPGYNTVDWYIIQGSSPSTPRSGAVMRGMSAVLRAIAAGIVAPVSNGGAKEAQGATVREIERLLDHSMTNSEPFRLFGRTLDILPYMPQGQAVIDDAAQAIKNHIGAGADISVIIITGGGAKLYADAIRSKFPHHQIVVPDQPTFANARGFHFLGTIQAESAQRAMREASAA